MQEPDAADTGVIVGASKLTAVSATAQYASLAGLR